MTFSQWVEPYSQAFKSLKRGEREDVAPRTS
jgi:hypothetical protein